LNESLIITLPVADQLYSLMQSDYVNVSEHGNEFVNCHTYEMPYEYDGFVAVMTRSPSKAKGLTNKDELSDLTVVSVDSHKSSDNAEIADDASFMDVDDISKVYNDLGQ
jgi:hypothetical protein